MITAKFHQSGFSISGHAGFAEFGRDIVCAAVSSAVMLTINGITEVLGITAKTKISENEILFELEEQNEAAEKLIKALRLHLKNIDADYPQTIRLT